MRIGLIGWAARTGCGHINRDLWDGGLIQEWLVPKHPVAGIDEALCPKEAMRTKVSGEGWVYDAFLDKIDVLLFIEQPYIQGFDITAEAHKRGKLVVCVPMMEWLPRAEWVANVDLMWAPTKWSIQELLALATDAHEHGVTPRWELGGIAGGWWGVDCEKFKFQPRTVCNRYLFLNGNGGVLLRKGSQIMADAARMVPEVPVLFRSQKKEMPRLSVNVQPFMDDAPERWNIYDKGDILVAPSRWEGLGLQLYEAQACGMPVFTTDGDPMRECNPFAKIPLARKSWVELCSRRSTTYECDPEALAGLMRANLNADISQASARARAHVEANHNLAKLIPAMREKIAERLAAYLNAGQPATAG